MIRVIIADDHLLFIDGLLSLLSNLPSIQVTDVANNGKQLLERLRLKRPDVVLLDINMPEMNGLAALEYIKQSFPALKVIMLSTYSEEHLVNKARQSGANGYLLKNCTKDELLHAIDVVHSGELCFPSQHAAKQPSFQTDSFLKQFSLSTRESEIIQYIKQAYTNQQIADRLYLSIYTVETHRKNIMQKLGLKTPSALMKFIVENKL